MILESLLFSDTWRIGFPSVLVEGWKGDDPCQNWYCIDCTECCITTINFMNINLTSIISPRFGYLTSLSATNVSYNRLTGTIPVELLTKLKKLSIMDISYNNLHWKVPEFRKEVIYSEENPQIEKDRIHVISRQFFIGNVIGFLRRRKQIISNSTNVTL